MIGLALRTIGGVNDKEDRDDSGVISRSRSSKNEDVQAHGPACFRFSEMLAYGLGSSGRSWLDSMRKGTNDDVAGVTERAHCRLEERDIRRQRNIETIFSLALGMLRRDTAPQDGHVDPDWSVRFIEAASDCGTGPVRRCGPLCLFLSGGKR